MVGTGTVAANIERIRIQGSGSEQSTRIQGNGPIRVDLDYDSDPQH